MRIAVIGKGNVGGGLADRWERAGHEVTRIGRDGGDVSGVDAVLLAVPGTAIADAVAGANGIAGKVIVDATNAFRAPRPEGFASLAEYVKSLTGGPVMKAFNTVFASLYDRLDAASSSPSCIYCGDDEARETTERLIRDAGFEPVSAGGLEAAGPLEDALRLIFAVSASGTGPFVYRIAPPEQL